MKRNCIFCVIVAFGICFLLISSLYLKAEEAEKETQGKEITYVCPMGEYESNEPGECPKCGMELVQKEQFLYRCPMGHYESDKPGKCPKCGMMLEKVEEPEEVESSQKEGRHKAGRCRHTC